MSDAPPARSLTWRVHMPVLHPCSLCRRLYDRASLHQAAYVRCEQPDGCPQVEIGYLCKFCTSHS